MGRPLLHKGHLTKKPWQLKVFGFASREGSVSKGKHMIFLVQFGINKHE